MLQPEWMNKAFYIKGKGSKCFFLSPLAIWIIAFCYQQHALKELMDHF